MKQHRNVFWKSFITHLAVVAAVALVLLPINAQIERALHVQEAETRRMTLETGLDMVTQQLKNLENTLTSTSDECFTRASLIDGAPAARDAVTINKVREQLAVIAGSNFLVADIVLCFSRNQMVITSYQSFWDFQGFLNTYRFSDIDPAILLQDGGQDPSHLPMHFYPCSGISSKSIFEEETAFCYAIPLNVISASSPAWGVAFVFIRRQPVLDSMMTSSVQAYGNLELSGQSGTLMSYQAKDYTDAAADDVVLSLVNATGTLKATARLPQRYFEDAAGPIQKNLILSLFIATLAGFLAAFWASYLQSRPMRRLLAELAEKGFLKASTWDECGEIRASLESLQLEHDNIARQLSTYQEAIRTNLADRLFHNSWITEEQEKQIREQFAPFPEQFLVCYGQIQVFGEGGKGAAVTCLLAVDLLRNRLPAGSILHPLDTDAFALIFPCPNGQEQGERALDVLLDLKKTRLQVSVLLSVGGCCSGLGEVCETLVKARMTCLRLGPKELASQPSSQILSYQQLENADGARLRMRDLQDLYHQLLAGESRHAVQIAESFFWENGSLEIDIEQRYYVLRGILMLVWEELAPRDAAHPDLPKYQRHRNPEELLATICTACQQTAETAKRQRSSQKDSQGERFLAYLTENYADPNCCAASMASAFKLSEKYLFSLFKEQTGYSPASYLQQIRLEKAAALLQTTALSVQEISVRVGFLNFSTFHKAFKREFGITPGQYRNQQQPGQSFRL